MNEQSSFTPSSAQSLITFLTQQSAFCLLEHERRVDSVHGCRYIGSYLDWVLHDRTWAPTYLVPASPLSIRPLVEYRVARWQRDRNSALMEPGGYRGRDTAPQVHSWPHHERVVIVSTSPTERLDLAMHACHARGNHVIGIISLMHESAGAQKISVDDTIVPFHALVQPLDLHYLPSTPSETAQIAS